MTYMRTQRAERAAELNLNTPLPPLVPFERCRCGTCEECRTNAKWDQAFAKFEIKEEDSWATKGLFQSTLRRL